MKAVIYARYSSDSQREESIEGQIRECTDYADRNDILVLDHYSCKVGMSSGTSRSDKKCSHRCGCGAFGL